MTNSSPNLRTPHSAVTVDLERVGRRLIDVPEVQNRTHDPSFVRGYLEPGFIAMFALVQDAVSYLQRWENTHWRLNQDILHLLCFVCIIFWGVLDYPNPTSANYNRSYQSINQSMTHKSSSKLNAVSGNDKITAKHDEKYYANDSCQPISHCPPHWSFLGIIGIEKKMTKQRIDYTDPETTKVLFDRKWMKKYRSTGTRPIERVIETSTSTSPAHHPTGFVVVGVHNES